MLLVDVSFSIVTEESAERGDAAEHGMHAESVPMTFRELVAQLREGEPSCYPPQGDVREWVTVDQGETRAWFERGEREGRGYHFGKANPARKARYWRLAMLAAHGRATR